MRDIILKTTSDLCYVAGVLYFCYHTPYQTDLETFLRCI